MKDNAVEIHVSVGNAHLGATPLAPGYSLSKSYSIQKLQYQLGFIAGISVLPK